MSTKQLTAPLITAPPSIPLNSVCYSIEIPDSDEWKDVFVGLLMNGTKWNNYVRSGTQWEATIARKWVDIINGMVYGTSDCSFCKQVEQRAGLPPLGTTLLQNIDNECGTSYFYASFCDVVLNCLSTSPSAEQFLACIAENLVLSCLEVPPNYPSCPTLCQQLIGALSNETTIEALANLAIGCGITVNGYPCPNFCDLALVQFGQSATQSTVNATLQNCGITVTGGYTDFCDAATAVLGTNPTLNAVISELFNCGIEVDMTFNTITNTLAAGEDATVTYDAATNTFTFGIPQGIQGVQGNDGECPTDCNEPIIYPDEPPPYENPPPADPACNAATRMVNVLEENTSQLIIEASQAATLTGFLATALALALGGFFTAIGVEALKTLFDLVKDSAVFTPAFWNRAKCDAYCLLPADGLFNDAIVEQLASTWVARGIEENDAKWTYLGLFVQALLINGINYAERVDPVPGADCTGCNCAECQFFDYAVSQGTSFKDPAQGANNTAVYVGGSYWDAALGFPAPDRPLKQLYVVQPLPSPVTITSVTMDYDLNKGKDVFGNGQVRIDLFRNGVRVGRETNDAPSNGMGSLVWNGSLEVDRVVLKIRAAAGDSASDDLSAAYGHLLAVEICE